MRKALLFSIFIVFASCLFGQQTSTKGTEFWVTFLQNYTASPKLTLYLSAQQSAVVTITNPNTSYTKTLNVAANSLVSDTVSISQCYNSGSGNIVNKGLKITSTSEITVYAWNYIAYTSDASVILPTAALGVKYRILSYKGFAASSPSEYGILATEDNTLINITPSCNTADNKYKDITYSITLHKGQTYQSQSKTDTSLTGTLIEVQNCKPIAVWGGAQCTQVPSGCSACDHLYEQLFPINMWGKEFILIPTASRTKDRYIILTDKSNTTVTINGSPTTITAAGGQYEADLTAPVYISSNKPLSVALYAVGQSCGGSSGDPMMMWVTPVEQNVNNIIFTAPYSSIITAHYVNIVAKTTTVGSIKLNGSNIGSLFSTVPSNPAYSYVKKSISTGANTIVSDSGFTAYAYGYGSAESYGYNVGSSIRDLNRFFTVNSVSNDNFSTPVKSMKVCKNAPIAFNGYSGLYTPLFWIWRFNNDTATTQNVTKTFTDTGVVKVMMITSWVGINLCTANDTTLDTAIQYIRVIEPRVDILNPDTAICRGGALQIRIALSGDSTISWKPSNNISCTNCAEPIITPVASQWYKVILGGGSLGCVVSDSIYIRVKDSVRFSIPKDTVICKGQKAIIRSNLLNKDSLISYSYKLFANNLLAQQDTIGYFDVYPDSTSTYFIQVNNTCYDANSSTLKVNVRQPLKLLFTDSFLICRNQNNSFTFKASGGDSSYSVYLIKNNSIVDSILNAVANVNYSFLFTPDPSSSYRLLLKDGCTLLNDSQTVHFRYRLPLSFQHTPDTLVCKQQAIHLNVKGQGGDSTYSFYLLKNNIVIDAILNANINTLYFFTVASTSNTLYKIVLTDGCTLLSDTQSVFVSVRNSIFSKISNDSNICEGKLTYIKVKPYGGVSNYNIYLLDSSARVDSIFNAAAGNIYSFAVLPTYKTKFKVVVSDGCTFKNDTQNVVYTFRAPLSFEHTPDTLVCAGQPAIIHVRPFGGDSTYWFYLISNNFIVDSLMNVSLAQNLSFEVMPNTTTNYTIILSDGCTYLNDTQNITVTLRNPLSSVVSNSDLICRGQSLAIAVTPSGGDSTYTIYLLDNNIRVDSIKNATSNTTYNFNAKPSLNSLYKIVLTDDCTVFNDTEKVNFSFREALSLVVSQDTTICIGQNFPIRVTPFGGDSTYTFYLLKNHVVIDSITNATIGNNYFFNVAPVLNTIYKIVLKDNCTLINDTEEVNVNVHKPLSFTYSNDVFICEGSLSDIRLQAAGGDSSYTFYLLDGTNTVDVLTNVLPNQQYQFFIHPTFLTHFKVVLTDGCTLVNDTQSVSYTFRPPIGFTHSCDTTICKGQTITLRLKPFGGDSTYSIYLIKNNIIIDSVLNAFMMMNYKFMVTPSGSTNYSILLSDECTYLNDTQHIQVNLRNPLSMKIVNDSVICRGQHLKINVTPFGGDSIYDLYLLNNNIIIDSIKNAVSNSIYYFDELPALTANYSFVLKDGCTLKNDSEKVNFTFRGPLTFTHSPNKTICIGQSANFRVTPFGGDSTYSIYLLKNGLVIDSISNSILGTNYYFNVAPLISTGYSIKITDGCTIMTDSQSIQVNVRNPLKVSVSKDTIICKGQTSAIPVIASGGDSSYTFYLLRNGVKIDSITNASSNMQYKFFVAPVVKTDYEILLVDGCTKLSDNAFITIDVYPPLQVKATISTAKICYGEKIALTALASGGAVNSVYSYLWNHGVGSKAITKISPPSSQWYLVKADDGCSSSAYDSVYIEVEPNPVAAFSASNTSGCEPFTTQFSNNSNTFSNVRYLWNFGDGTTDTCTTPLPHTFVKPGCYEVKLCIVSAFGCVDSIVKKNYIIVNPNPVIKLKIDPRKVKVNNGKISFNAGLKFTDEFDFDFGDAKNILSQPFGNNIFAHIYTDTGYFSVKLSARNKFGCTSELSDSLFIEDYYTVFIPNVFSPNNKDGKNDFFRPVSTFSKQYDMNIYDRWGQLVFSESCNDRWFNCKGWDGTYKNQPVQEDTYIYLITLYEENGGKTYFEKGTVMVLR